MRKILRAIFTLLFVAAGVISAPTANAALTGAPVATTAFPTADMAITLDMVDNQIWTVIAGSKLQVLNKADGTVLQTITLANSFARFGSFDANNVWYSNIAGGGAVTKIDRTTYTPTQISLGGMPTRDAYSDGTYVWVTSPASNKVYQLSATDGSVVHTITSLTSPQKVISDGTNVWVTYNDGTSLAKLNHATGAVLNSGISTTIPSGNLSGMTLDEDSFWIFSSGGGQIQEFSLTDGSVIQSFVNTITSNIGDVRPYGDVLFVCMSGSINSYVYDNSGATATLEYTFSTFANMYCEYDGEYLYSINYSSQINRFSSPFQLSAPNSPGTPTATPGNGDALVSWSAPVGGDAPSSYTVTSSPGGLTCTVNAPATSCTVEGLTNGTEYTFTVVATNSGGDSAPSSASAGITPVDVVPGAPGTPTATPGVGQAEVSWTAPNSGGASVSYTVTSAPGGFTCTVDAPATSCVVEGLTNGTEYTFTVVATNTGGDSAPSSASAGVTPAPDEYVVTISKTGKGSVSNSTATVDGGEVFTSTATPKKGYKFDGWVCEPDSVSTTARTLTFTVTEAVSCVATFSKKDAPVVEPSDSDIKVVFELDSWKLGNVQATALYKMVASIKKAGYSTITITGYTDNTGSVKANRNLSLARAKAVRNFLKPYLPKVKFVVVAGGSSNPVASNATEAGRAQNRRAEISFS